MKILIVDAGNYCRSPVAECVLKKLHAQAQSAAALSFSSAGLKDKHAGDGADPRSIAACNARGYDLTAHRCREITADDFRDCDLILAMDRDNLAQLKERQPVNSRTQLALFLGDAEVPDPYYGGNEGFATMMDLVEAGARLLLTRLRSTT
jgi:protein-tyrosine phosphatase